MERTDFKPPLTTDAIESIFDALGDVVFCVKDIRGRYLSVNQAFVERVHAGSRRELIGKTAHDLFPQQLAATYQAQDDQVIADRQPIHDQLEQITNADGSLGWYLASKFPLLDSRGKVVALVGLSQDLHAPSARDIEMANVKGVVEFIHAHIDQSLRSEQLAARASMSVEQLDRRMKRLFRLSTKKYIMKVRLEEAIRRLRQTDQPLAQIADACGFSDQSAFTRQFRAATKLTPAAYRRQGKLPPGEGET